MLFFFYGTLRDPEIRLLVLGPGDGALPVISGILRHWRCVQMIGVPYPVIVPSRGSTVQGCVSADLGQPEAARLLRYEGVEYRVRTCPVYVEAQQEPLSVGVFTPSPRARPSSRLWVFEDWARKERSATLRRIRMATE